MKAAVEAGENVVLEKDLSLNSTLEISGDKEVTIDLNGQEVTTTNNTFVEVKENAKVTLTGGTVTVHRINRAPMVVRASDGGVAVIDGGVYNSEYLGLSANTNGQIIVNDGTFTANEFVCSPQNGGKMIINGGTFTAKDNAVVATNGSPDFAGSELTINGGVFNGNITTDGYIACGVYVANNDTVNINGGTFNITDGVGILMRAGNTTIGKDVVINLVTNNSAITEGWIGDAKVPKIPVSKALVKDVKANYPGASTNFEVINNSTYELTTLE